VVHKQVFNRVPQSFEQLDAQSKADGVFETIIKLNDESYSNKALLEFLQNNEVISFNEVIPSMEDIFIMAVENTK
jgi:ABC-2 type transport system ATP-binding protein